MGKQSAELKLTGKNARKVNLDEYVRTQKAQDPEFAAAHEESQREHAIGLELARLRKRAGLGQKEVGARMHTSQQAVGRMESAAYRGHNLGTVFRYVEALGGSLEIKATKQGFRIEVSAPAEVK